MNCIWWQDYSSIVIFQASTLHWPNNKL